MGRHIICRRVRGIGSGFESRPCNCTYAIQSSPLQLYIRNRSRSFRSLWRSGLPTKQRNITKKIFYSLWQTLRTFFAFRSGIMHWRVRSTLSIWSISFTLDDWKCVCHGHFWQETVTWFSTEHRRYILCKVQIGGSPWKCILHLGRILYVDTLRSFRGFKEQVHTYSTLSVLLWKARELFQSYVAAGVKWRTVFRSRIPKH